MTKKDAASVEVVMDISDSNIIRSYADRLGEASSVCVVMAVVALGKVDDPVDEPSDGASKDVEVLPGSPDTVTKLVFVGPATKKKLRLKHSHQR